MDDTFLTTDEVLEYLQVNLRTVYRLIKAGKLPAVRVGRQWRVRRADLDQWLSTQRTGPQPSMSRESALAPESGASPSPNLRPRVLVVDDEAGIRDLLSKTLALAEYDVETVPDGRAALAALRNQTFDLLITDLRMPGMDGMALIQEARRLLPRLPAVVITAYSTEASAIEAVNLGVSAYITKPFRITKILSTTAKILGD
jgi:excisionase family DNA binding protein